MGTVDSTERAPIDTCDECGFPWDEYDDITAVPPGSSSSNASHPVDRVGR